MKYLLEIVILSIVGLVLSQEIPDNIDELQNQIGEVIPEFADFDKSQLPAAEEVENVLRDKCDKVGGEGTFDKLKQLSGSVQSCIADNFNQTQIAQEIEEAKKTGSMDEVFGKYCNKYPDVKDCMSNFTNAMYPCLTDKEIVTYNQTLKLIDEIKEFTCFKNGDRLALFVAEGGVDCFESQRGSLQECMNSTFGNRLPQNFSIAGNLPLPTFVWDTQTCNDVENVRGCINIALEKCEDSTSANLIDAFFKYLKKILPCQSSITRSKLKPKALSKSEEKSYSISSNSLALTSSFALLTTTIIFSQFS